MRPFSQTLVKLHWGRPLRHMTAPTCPVTTQTVQSPRAVSMHCARHYKCHALADSLPPRRHAPIARGKGHA